VLEYGSLKPAKREGAADLDSAVFMSDVSRKTKGKGREFHNANDGGHDDNIKVNPLRATLLL
jgi:hypothetical protein